MRLSKKSLTTNWHTNVRCYIHKIPQRSWKGILDTKNKVQPHCFLMGSACWLHTAAPLREIFPIQQYQKIMLFQNGSSFLDHATSMNSDFLGRSGSRIFKGFCEQTVTTCVMAPQACFVPKSGLMYLDLRSSNMPLPCWNGQCKQAWPCWPQ